MARQTRKSRHKVRTHKTSRADALLAFFPDDVLARTFLWLRELYVKDFQGRKKLGWIVASHVSQRWRNIALGCGTLWGHIHSADPAVAEWLKRAGDTTLSVKVQIQAASDEDTLILLLQRLSQIESLSIEIKASITPIIYHKIWKHLLVIYSNPAPILDLFEIEDDIGCCQNPRLHLFDENAPVLRRFSARGFTPILPSPSFDNLTTFFVSHPPEPLNKFTLLSQLGRLPNLEYLMLEDPFVPMEQALDALPNFPISHLPKLTDLIFDGAYFNTDLDFLSHLSFPEKTAVMFLSIVGSTDLSAFPRFIQAYNQARNPPCPIRMLRLGWGDHSFQIVTSKTFISSTPDDHPAELAFRLKGPWGDGGAFPTSWGEELVRLPLSRLEYFYTECEIGTLAWSLLSKECRELTYLSLKGPATMEFLSLSTISLFAREARRDGKREGDISR